MAWIHIYGCSSYLMKPSVSKHCIARDHAKPKTEFHHISWDRMLQVSWTCTCCKIYMQYIFNPKHMNFCNMNQIWKRLRIIYFPPIIVLNFCNWCNYLIFQVLISLMRWCITEDKNGRETSSGPRLIYQTVASHQTMLFVICHYYQQFVKHAP